MKNVTGLYEVCKTLAAARKNTESLCNHASDKGRDPRKAGVTWLEYRALVQELGRMAETAIAMTEL